MLLLGPDLHRVGPQAPWDFRNIFLPNTGEAPKKSYLGAGPLAPCHVFKSVPGYCITFANRLDEGLS